MSKIAMLVTEQFEDSEAQQPLDALKKAGHQVEIISPEAGKELRGKKGKVTLKSDLAIKDAKPDNYDALLIPGGHSPEKLRCEPGAVEFVKAFKDKPIAAICHGPQLLISAEMVKDRKMTCYKSIAIDLKNAGARFEDSALVIDGNLITSRQPDDLPRFCEALVKAVERQPAQRPS